MTERDDSFSLPTITFGSVELGHGPDIGLNTGLELGSGLTPATLEALDPVALSPATGDVVATKIAPALPRDEAGAQPQARTGTKPTPLGPQRQDPPSSEAGAGPRDSQRRRASKPRAAGQDRPGDSSAAKAAPSNQLTRPERGHRAAGAQLRPHVPSIPGRDPAVAPPLPQQPAIVPPDWPSGGAIGGGPGRLTPARQAPPGVRWPGPHQQRRRYQPVRTSSSDWHQLTHSRVLKAVGKIIPLLLLVWIVGLLIAFFQVVASP